MPQQTNYSKIKRVMNAVVAGTTDTQTTSIVDTQGFQGCRFICAFGTISASSVSSVSVQEGAAAAMGDAANLAGSGVSLTPSTDNNKVVIVDVYKPAKRYLWLIVTRTIANVVIDGIFAELYEGRDYPEAADATVSHQTLLVSPAEGTP